MARGRTLAEFQMVNGYVFRHDRRFHRMFRSKRPSASPSIARFSQPSRLHHVRDLESDTREKYRPRHFTGGDDSAQSSATFGVG
jgi:hypothetical protein